MTKKELRKLYLEKRKELSEGDCAALNLKLYSLFFSSIDLSFIQVLHIYLPIAHNQEPDTWMIIDRVRREFPHVRISLPRVGANDKLENIYFEGQHQLQTSAWGIPEPKQGVPTPDEKIDLVIVPLLAVDALGHRVGYGRGFYDRLLKRLRPDCIKVGLSFFDAVDRIEDIDEHDVALNQCVTPSKTILF